MNCSDFEQRMLELIDDRACLRDDDLLAAHARWCTDCRETIETWQQIDAVLDHDASTADDTLQLHAVAGANAPSLSTLTRYAALAAVAAGLLIAVTILPTGDAPVEEAAVAINIEQPPQELPLDPVVWWQNVQQRDWIADTMPAVHSVRDGVAPLGRSLLHAVAILTTSRGERTS